MFNNCSEIKLWKLLHSGRGLRVAWDFHRLLFCFQGKAVKLFGSLGRNPCTSVSGDLAVAAPACRASVLCPAQMPHPSLKGLFYGELYASSSLWFGRLFFSEPERAFVLMCFTWAWTQTRALSGDRILYWKHRDLPGGSVAKTPCCQCKKAWV